MSTIVQKYGGSSLATTSTIRDIAKRIANSYRDGNRLVVVVSAMGNTTNDLIDLAQNLSSTPPLREMDMLLSTGELVSSALLAIALNAEGIDAISLSGAQAGIKTNTTHGKARIEFVDPRRILGELDKNKIVVVAGFQGIDQEMEITTLGRGASDLSAVAIAAGLGTDICEIYTDVDGIYTADPKLVRDARKLDEIEYEEMLELASYGAKMDPRSIELAMVYQVPVTVASSFAKTPGTKIHQGGNMDSKIGEIRNRVRSIASDTDIAKITVLGVMDKPGIAANLFRPLAEADISVDVIVQNTSLKGYTDLTFTVKRTDLNNAIAVVNSVADTLGSRGISSTDNLAKVSIVGTGMRDAPGYASKLFSTLGTANINIEMITTSEIRITCIIDSKHVEKATKAIHEAFELANSG